VRPLFRLVTFWRHLSPPGLFVASFLLLVVIGTVGFLWLPGLYTGQRLGLVDALFTATSAVCVTGLIVVDTATYFTRWGQLWILILIQLGGLGLITLTTLIIGALGQRLSLRSEMLAVPVVSQRSGDIEVASMAFAAARFALTLELAGAILLWPQFLVEFEPVDALWHAVFQAVSAFCNAGFSTFSASLAGHAARPGILFVISVLIVLGGLGYLTVDELTRRWRSRRQRAPRRLSSHSFAALSTTILLLGAGTVAFAALEWRGVLEPLGVVDRLMNAWFMAVTPRTAGFNTIDYTQVANDTAFLTVLLMAVGGSPGSMAGGLKTTTAAILVALALSRVRARRHVELHGRTVPESTVTRTVSLVLVGFALVTVSVFVLNMAEARGPVAEHRQLVLPLIFEVVSAFGTVGLSMDVTPTLGVFGKVLETLLMFLGRVGPLSFFAALSIRTSRLPSGMRSAHEDVIVG
jgi:trk system potassium uptake protein